MSFNNVLRRPNDCGVLLNLHKFIRRFFLPRFLGHVTGQSELRQPALSLETIHIVAQHGPRGVVPPDPAEPPAHEQHRHRVDALINFPA